MCIKNFIAKVIREMIEVNAQLWTQCILPDDYTVGGSWFETVIGQEIGVSPDVLIRIISAIKVKIFTDLVDFDVLYG